MLLRRRGLISGLLAMPAVVQADRLMRISAPKPELFTLRIKLPDDWEPIYSSLTGDLIGATRTTTVPAAKDWLTQRGDITRYGEPFLFYALPSGFSFSA